MQLREQGIHHGLIYDESNVIAHMHHLMQSTAAAHKKDTSLEGMVVPKLAL
jgi:hypothetical protein